MFKKRTILISIFFLTSVFAWMALSKEKVTPTKVALKSPVKTQTKASVKTTAKPAAKPAVESSSSQRDKTAQDLFNQAQQFKNDRQLLKAKEIYQKIANDYSSFEKMDQVQAELENVNMQIILSNLPVPDKTVIHTVETGDSLGKIALKYGTTIDLIKRNNNLKSDVIRLGQKLRIWTVKFNIFVDKSQNVLLLKEGTDVIKSYHVSTGENNSTPVGQFKITSRLVDPVWYNKGVVISPESPENVLGTRWLGFDIPGYGIHGTIEPDKIGQQVTAGCVRMRNQEVEELYSIVPMGTLVNITD